MSPVDGAVVVVNLLDGHHAVVAHIDAHEIRSIEAEAPLAFAALVELRHEEVEGIAALESVAGPVPVGILRSGRLERRAERRRGLLRPAVAGAEVAAVGGDVDQRVIDHLEARIAFSVNHLAQEAVSGHEERRAVVEQDRDRTVRTGYAALVGRIDRREIGIDMCGIRLRRGVRPAGCGRQQKRQ